MNRTQVYLANMLGESYASLGRKHGISAKRVKTICNQVEMADHQAWLIARTMRTYKRLVVENITRHNGLLQMLNLHRTDNPVELMQHWETF